ncbi:hypothetical protein [Methylomonas fluvii]|uniref:Uncharacterized protein n=1 Tax=Methylomonas fluvii TaxID=1854564 RepID=A0ABR9DCT9_9GAMM|nr:hypothetical protein [Methylomonas fluvii]MBD9360904.1 hypothetical protein [Methylomonas fluvii]
MSKFDYRGLCFYSVALMLVVSLARRLILMSVLAPTGAILSFAPPKESIQRKGGPDAAYILRSEAFAGG